MADPMTVDRLIAIAMESPERNLSRKSLQCLMAFLTGYDMAHVATNGTWIPDEVDRAAWADWLIHHSGASRQDIESFTSQPFYSPESYVQLLAEDDRDACDMYIALRAEVKPFAQPTPAPPKVDTDSNNNFQSLPSALATLCTRPAMYLGNDISTFEIYAFAKGYAYFDQRDRMSLVSNLLLQQFQEWINRRYPFAVSRPWSHTIHYVALSNGPQAIKKFDELFRLFLEEAPPDVPDPIVTQIIENIQNAIRQKTHDSQSSSPED